jgi:GNAT superfamily N-acetyltransferase
MTVTFSPAEPTPERLQQYVGLFTACFPKSGKLTIEYLRWLYLDNPCGRVIGVDALAEGQVVAHYAVVPVDVSYGGTQLRACWSLNTATHPSYQGQGLFVKLANMTYELAKGAHCLAVIGVANQNSVQGFVRRLGFAHLGHVTVALGFGAVRLTDPEHSMHRYWPTQLLTWRLKNPSRTYYVHGDGRETWIYTSVGPARTPVLLGYAVDGRRATDGLPALPRLSLLQPKMLLGYGTKTMGVVMPVPQRLLPSPWHVIFRPLSDFKNDKVPLGILGIDLDTF